MTTMKAKLSSDYVKQLVLCLVSLSVTQGCKTCGMQELLLLWSDAVGMLLTSELFLVFKNDTVHFSTLF